MMGIFQQSQSSSIQAVVVINLQHKDLVEFLRDTGGLFVRRISSFLKKKTVLKVNATFCGEFIVIKGDEEVFEFKYLKTKNSPVYHDTEVDEWFGENVRDPIVTQLEEFQEKDRDWALNAIINISFNINRFTPQVGSSYIELPKIIRQKKACIDVKNHDEA
ncbi:hypothetical protein Trydic_g4984 [Trypoxylus dichotomus]